MSLKFTTILVRKCAPDCTPFSLSYYYVCHISTRDHLNNSVLGRINFVDLKPRTAVLRLFSFDNYCSTALAMLPNEKSLKNTLIF